MSETVELDRESNPQAVRGYAYFDWAKSSFETSVTVAEVWPAKMVSSSMRSIDLSESSITSSEEQA